MPENVLDWGIELILSLQMNFGWADGVMNFFSFLGNEDFFLVFFPFLIWCVDMSLGFRVYFFFGVSVYTNSILKVLFNDPRPYWYDGRVALTGKPEFVFGLPSGHSQNAVIIWGFLANAIKKSWSWIAAGLLVLLIGYSRMQLGVHFPTDVFVGWGFGLLLLVLLFWLEKPVLAWFRRFGPQQQVITLFAAAVGFILLAGWINNTFEASYIIPEEWIQNVTRADPEVHIDPFSLSPVISGVASIFGGLVGFIWLQPRGGMDSKGPWLKRVLRYGLGLVIAVVIWLGLNELFALLAADETLFGQMLRFIRYTAVGLWVGGFGPMTFRKLNLAEAQQPS